MKLAEALILRADYQKRVDQLNERLMRNSKIQEGDTAAEEPQELLKELDELFGKLETLIKQISKTNAKTSFDHEKSLAEALIERDMVGKKRKVLSELLDSGTFRHDRFSRSEVKYISTFDIKRTQIRVDDLSKQYRKIDTKIQEINWQTELLK